MSSSKTLQDQIKDKYKNIDLSSKDITDINNKIKDTLKKKEKTIKHIA